MTPLHRAMRIIMFLSIYTVVTLSICSGLAAILGKNLLPVAIIHVAELQYHITDLILAFDIAVSP